MDGGRNHGGSRSYHVYGRLRGGACHNGVEAGARAMAMARAGAGTAAGQAKEEGFSLNEKNSSKADETVASPPLCTKASNVHPFQRQLEKRDQLCK